MEDKKKRDRKNIGKLWSAFEERKTYYRCVRVRGHIVVKKQGNSLYRYINCAVRFKTCNLLIDL